MFIDIIAWGARLNAGSLGFKLIDFITSILYRLFSYFCHDQYQDIWKIYQKN